ncbi:hypothetical protein BDZ90DRAFT_275367 [Jaminaea rosea]|uniref:DNA-directed RNA polymerase III subunit RPC3 n=1 Tax=Jaminaea rosea TaxID=1569628 RepID=A0A316UN01_9BASI|nr:hypothetical protein BDZ90DRAFT_275367 [Jaminaea rosea]PWN26188.1 hypothetical protein BDZ90DRAFT_275367 [Jaminaea rosea]
MPPAKQTAMAAGGDDEDEDPSQLHVDGMSSSRTTNSREKLRLCQQIVADHFGPVAEQVSSVLLQRGRLSLNDIERFLRVPPGTVAAGSSSLASTSSPNAPQLSRSQILHTLIVLVQHNILYHIRLDADGSFIEDVDQPGGVEYFVINTEIILARSRFGIFMETAESQWGYEGLEIVSQVLQHGKIQVADLLKQMPSTSAATRPLITHLLLSSYLVTSTQIAHWSPHDMRIAYNLQATKAFKGIPSQKEKQGIAAGVSERILKERRKAASTGCIPRTKDHWYELKASKSGSKSRAKASSSSSAAAAGKKRRKNLALEDPSDDSETEASSNRGKKANGSSSKRSRDANGSKVDSVLLNPHPAVNGSDSHARPAWMDALSDAQQSYLDEWIVDDSAFVRLNYDRFDVHIRNELLCSLVEKHYNESAAKVYMAIVEAADARSLESSSGVDGVVPAPSVSDSVSLGVSLTRLSSTLNIPSSVLAVGFDATMLTNLSHAEPGKKPVKHDFLLEYVALLLRAEDTLVQSSRKPSDLSAATRFLVPGVESNGNSSSSGGGLSTFTGARIPNAVSIDYSSAGRKLKWHLLRKTVESTLGETEARVLGVLRREGKLEEKHISKLALCALGEAREACARLFGQGIVSLQEVPKSADRNPQRTFFLYFLDYPRALAWLGDHLAKTQARLAQRRNVERGRERTLLAKIERTDVRDEGVENVLSEVERERLDNVKERLIVLTGEEMRVMREAWILARMRG